jgi:hypothetical protein
VLFKFPKPKTIRLIKMIVLPYYMQYKVNNNKIKPSAHRRQAAAIWNRPGIFPIPYLVSI